jgi:methionyl-tRNA formyltransferase
VKVIFAGTSEFAVPTLEALIASPYEVAAVITQPDKPSGRGKEVHMPPTKLIPLAHSIPVLQPTKMRDPASIGAIKAFGPVGAMVVAAYGQIVPPELLEWPAHGCINVHGSILPKYRGAAPIQHALIAGETQTGVTTMLMDEGLDTGDILLQESVDIHPHENAGDLAQRLALLGADLLIRTLKGLEQGTIAPVAQDNQLATFARSLKRDAGAIDWSRSADDIVNLIRGCTPKPGASTSLGEKQVKVWSAIVAQRDGGLGEPGVILAADNAGITVAAGTGSVRLIDVQPESRKRMSAAEFARGGVKAGQRFDVRFEMPPQQRGPS